jgi:hypothetical protein
MTFPWHDWQFWVVTLACLAGFWGVLSPFLPRSGRPTDACGGCAAGTAACARQRALERAGGRRSPTAPHPTGPLVVLDDGR